jgi:hypothetical protein
VSNATVVFELENATEITGEITMDDSTKTGSTVVQLYTSNDVGSNSPPPLKGTLLTFVDGRYYVGAGKFRTEIAPGARFVVTEVRAGWRRWQDAKVVAFVAEINGRYPARHQLGHTDEREWAPGPGGKPSDPWQDSREVVMIREIDFAEFTFCISTVGGRSAIDALRNSMANARLLGPGQFPIIELAWRQMQTSYGMKPKPDLKIVGWWRSEAPSITPPDNPAA